MSRIRSTGTQPEETVRKFLFSRGFRYRKNDRRLPGRPDVVLPRYRAAIFVHGCFWHGHEGCPKFVQPKSNQDYWGPKLERNHLRDAENTSLLQSAGWRVKVVWECELKGPLKQPALEKLAAWILEVQPAP
jgi:DNA mismatch endonuclease (patch repair protein)